jgi:two-component system response regulator DctR
MNAEVVHIVDDDAAVRDALGWLIASAGMPLKTYGSAEAFLNEGGLAAVGALVLDVRMAGMSGLELFDRLRASGSTLQVVFLTGHGDVPLAVNAIKSGAFDFLEKPFDDLALLEIVRRALDAARRLREAEQSAGENAKRLRSLSEREQQVMDRMIAGKANKVIAAELDIAVRTVEVHRARILAKMGVRTAVELAAVVSSLRH